MAKNNLGRSPLSRGLDSMLSESPLPPSSIGEVKIDFIKPNEDQPRREFDQEKLNQLADSIKSIGIVQPITVKEIDHDSYIIISGERRWRAAKIAQLTTIPAYITKASDEQVREMALVENIQREDLNPIEISLAYQQILSENNLTQEDLGKRIGKTRSSISNYLRLLKLPAEIQLGLVRKKVDMGHARTLLALDDSELQLAVYNKIVEENLSVRQVEEIVRAYSENQSEAKTQEQKKANERKAKTPNDYGALEEHLSRTFKTKVKLSFTKSGGGKFMIPFKNEAQFESIMELLDGIKS